MQDQKNDKPVEIYCPICGFSTLVKETEHNLTGLSRDERVRRVKELQAGDTPIFMCDGCDNPEQSAGIMEVK